MRGKQGAVSPTRTGTPAHRTEVSVRLAAAPVGAHRRGATSIAASATQIWCRILHHKEGEPHGDKEGWRIGISWAIGRMQRAAGAHAGRIPAAAGGPTDGPRTRGRPHAVRSGKMGPG